QLSQWVEDIARFPALLRAAVQHLTPEQLNTPYRAGGWTIRQVVHHVADNDMNAYFRFKRALTEENPTAATYRQDAWAELNDYQEPVDASLLLIESLHSRFVTLLRALQPTEFQRTFMSPAHGAMSLYSAIQRFAWHNLHHLAQVQSLVSRSGW
ncbi:MAG: metal-dependent hydrolase, partial [Paenibacillus sp.]|nr:metal-dependent hydrolase [Paenibacillus sp.]